MHQRNICFLLGVNGVGKSTLARAIAAAIPGTALVGASDVLRRAFGGVSREHLEAMDPARKREVLRDAMLRTFEEHRHAPLVACDTHLVVSIRTAATTRREHMWEDAYAPHGRAFLYVTAPTAAIMARREQDERETGRRRDARAETVMDDEAVNRAEFAERLARKPGALVVTNTGPTALVAAQIVGLLNGS